MKNMFNKAMYFTRQFYLAIKYWIVTVKVTYWYARIANYTNLDYEKMKVFKLIDLQNKFEKSYLELVHTMEQLVRVGCPTNIFAKEIRCVKNMQNDIYEWSIK